MENDVTTKKDGATIMTEQIGFNIPKELLTPIIRDTVSVAIMRELGDPGEIIRHIVGKALSEKVASNGKKSGYDYENKYTYLELMSGNYIRKLAEEAMQEIFNENKDAVKEAIKNSLKKSGDIGEIICNGFFSSLESRWNSEIVVSLNTQKE